MTDGLAFDARSAPLAGENLVEASAGTGKTHAITTLYERLIVESGATVEEILVVTYTKAATAELKERVRARLLGAQRTIRSGNSGLDLPEEELAKASDALDRAVRDFDRAAIHTIHGFCQRVLEDLAFEGGQPFVTELLADDSALIHEIARDFWRNYVTDADDHWAMVLANARVHPVGLAAWVRQWVGRHPLRLKMSGAVEADVVRLMESADSLSRLPDAWQDSREEVRKLLLDNPSLNRNSYRPARVAEWLDTLDALSKGETVLPDALETVLERFSASALEAKTKKAGVVPRHPFFDLVEAAALEHQAIAVARDSELVRMRAKFLAFTREEIVRRNREGRTRTFDDLIHSLGDALEREGEPLAQALRERHPYALIDEFQDTDPAQLRIFQTIYAGGRGTRTSGTSGAPGAVFFVGDPKQAIYAFRGADIFAYLEGRAGAERVYTLGDNRRSTRQLVDAVNAIFSVRPDAFGLSAIEFRAAGATIEQDVLADGIPAPFVIHELPEPEAKPWGKDEARQLSAHRAAEEIARLLEKAQAGEATLNSRPIVGSDLAVLVRTNYEGELVRDALAARGIGSVRTGPSNVFSTEEAAALRGLLCAVLTPQREAWLRAALLGPFFERNAEDLSPSKALEPAWSLEVDRFHRWHEVWNAQGFGVMFRVFLDEAKTLTRTLSRPSGERATTNLLQLGELLTRAETEFHLTPGELLAWLDDRRARSDEINEEAEQRLESDADHLRIMTVHRAKGLQFPIVFCPFLWDGPSPPKSSEGLLYHPGEETNEALPVLELGPDIPELARELSDKEAFSESLRLLYVALTRAQHRCHVVWGNVNRSERSPLGWLLAGVPGKAAESDWAARWDAVAADAPTAFVRCGQSPQREGQVGTNRLMLNPASPSKEHLVAKRFTGRTERTWGVSSFTSITAQLPAELPDHDGYAGNDAALYGQAPEADEVPRGPRVGTCIHGILERIEFTRPLDEQRDIVRSALQEYGLGDEHAGPIFRLLESTLTARLSPNEEVSLKDIPSTRRVAELEFHFPVNAVSLEALASVVREHALLEHVAIGEGQSLAGYLKGYIDLVFEYSGRYYVVDYKSHWLGPRATGYGPAALRDVMVRDNYALQYLLYCVAVHRYLACRLPSYRYESHFGGVYYLFLRGMENPGQGIFFERPRIELINELDRLLAGTR